MRIVRDSNIDALKGAAIIGVVGIHVLTIAGRAAPLEFFVLGILTRFSTPAFFFASGWLNQLPGNSKNFVSLLALLYRRARRLAPAWVFWTAASFAVCRVYGIITADWPSYLQAAITGNAPFAYQLYYVPVLLECCLLLLLSRRMMFFVALLSFCFLVAIDLAVCAFPATAGKILTFARPAWVSWAGYFLTGYILREIWEAPDSPWCLLASVAAGLEVLTFDIGFNLYSGVDIFAAVDFIKPGAAVYSLPVILLLMSLPPVKVLCFLGRFSAGIYFCHLLVLFALLQVSFNLFAPGRLLLTTCLTVFLSGAAAALASAAARTIKRNLSKTTVA